MQLEVDLPEVFSPCGGDCTLKRGSLTCANVVAFLLHTALFVVTLALSNLDLTVPLYRSEFEVLTDDTGMWRVYPGKAIEAGRMSPPYAVAFFFFLSALFHLGNGVLWNSCYFSGIERCTVPTRWIEYAFSASLMQVLISYIVGLIFLNDLILVFGLSFCVMAFGYASELLNRPKEGKNEWKGGICYRLQLHLVGWAPFVLLWFVFFYNFYNLADAPVAPSGTVVATMPDFVYAIVWAQFFLYVPFGVVQLVQICLPPSSYVWGELAFIILSFTSKTVLGLILLVNVLVLGDYADAFLPSS